MNTYKFFVRVFFVSVCFLVIVACDDTEKNEDVTNTVNKSGAVESAVKVEHIDSLHDILITTHAVWANNILVKNIEYRDTLPTLGSHTTTAENQEGESKQVVVKKDYEIFITVK